MRASPSAEFLLVEALRKIASKPFDILNASDAGDVARTALSQVGLCWRCGGARDYRADGVLQELCYQCSNWRSIRAGLGSMGTKESKR